MHESSKITLIKSLFVRPDRELPARQCSLVTPMDSC